MFNALKKVCDNNPTIVSSIPAFVLLVNRLAEFMVAIKNLMRKLLENNSGNAGQKAIAKAALGLNLAMLGGAGRSYARSIKDVVLYEKFHFAESTLTDMRDAVLIETANSLKSLMNEYSKELEPYNINEEFIAELNKSLSDFEEINTSPIVNVYTGEAERSELIKVTFEGSDFVFNDLMAAALMFKKKHGTFYDSLVNASRVSKVGIRHDDVPSAIAELKKEIAAQKKMTKAAKKSELEKRLAEEKAELAQVLQELNANTQDVPQENGQVSAV
jgi:hypothetical protein